jgi:iron complex transport system substrate-binding protein
MARMSAAVLGLVAMVAAGCASSAETREAPPSTVATTTTVTAPETVTSTSDAPASGFPVTIVADNGEVTIDARPQRIVSISPTSTEVLFAIGAGDQVVAVDSLSNHPPGAPVTELSGFSPNVEAIAAFDPDLVFLSFDPDEGLIPALGAVGIPTVLHGGPADLEAAFEQWLQVGSATGNEEQAVTLVEETRDRIGRAYASLPAGTEGLSYYWELDQAFYSVTSATFIGDLLSGTSMTNIAEPADEDGFGYPQLTSEYIIGSDPDFIFLADTICCGQTVSTVSSRPGWDTMSAISGETIVELDDDIASRWGPRIVDLVEQIVGSVSSAGE